MFFKKRREQRENEMADMIKTILPPEATLVLFEYNAKYFGNIIVKIKTAKERHTFVTDRGEIYHNGKLLCDSSYHSLEKEDTFPKMIQMIKKELLIREIE